MALHRLVNLGDSPELKRRDVLGKILVEDGGRRCNIEECFGSPLKMHDTGCERSARRNLIKGCNG
jgi:hypothetical protein